MKDLLRPGRMWRTGLPLKKRYDVVIIGGGVQGPATAYYRAKNHGITDVAVLEKSYIGSGGSGRNTAIVRSNYRTPEGASFYQASLDLYDDLSAELDFNIMLTKRGVLSLAHSERALATATERASWRKRARKSCSSASASSSGLRILIATCRWSVWSVARKTRA
ncbi:MAG: FAD-dependent oxidoreductase, partial [Actinobacteria bacterium]|nr:FAD-dependent oxidoreductase [Actinomycetota bacterium]